MQHSGGMSGSLESKKQKTFNNDSYIKEMIGERKRDWALR